VPIDCSLLDDACAAGVCDAATGVCVAGEPSQQSCDDQNACTTDRCDGESGCVHDPVVCDDGDACTTDTCDAAGGCGHAPIDCDDGDPCTQDACAVETGCTHEALVCDDGDACTIDACDATAGCIARPIDCGLLTGPCGVGVCDGQTGTCVIEATPGVDCDDGDACTSDDVCAQDGTCAGSTTTNCDDGDACTTDTCEAKGGCGHAPIDCDDGDQCTQDACEAETGCTHEALGCDDGDACTTDTCNAEVGCGHAPIDCDDGMFCNGAETCDAERGCEAGEPPLCDDLDSCTVDSCSDQSDECQHVVDPSAGPDCGDLGQCAGGEELFLDLLDFEGLAAGTVVSEVTGVLGEGPVEVSAFNPRFGDTVNAALIYDSSCSAGFCSGGDYDLGTPNQDFAGPGIGNGGRLGKEFANFTPQGNVLITAENLVDTNGDMLIDDPDDQGDRTVTTYLDFFGLGEVTVYELTLIDLDFSEKPATVEMLAADGTVLASVVAPYTGDNGVVLVDLEATSGVATVRVTLRGSGALDDVLFAVERCAPADVLQPTSTTLP